MYEADFEDLEFEPFEKFRKVPKTGAQANRKKSETQIRTARRTKEKAKQAALEEIESAE